MEEKKITERESIELITSMINSTKQRYIGNGHIMLMWGYLVVSVSILVWIMTHTTHHTAWNWLWFAIPVTGGIVTPIMARKEKHRQGVTTYSDKITSRLWTLFGLSEIVLTLMCLVLKLAFNVNCWSAMLAYSLIVAAFAETIQGIILKENSLIAGGITGWLIGMVALCCMTGDIVIKANWFMPLFILAFVCMMIIPGHTLNYKAKHR